MSAVQTTTSILQGTRYTFASGNSIQSIDFTDGNSRCFVFDPSDDYAFDYVIDTASLQDEAEKQTDLLGFA